MKRIALITLYCLALAPFVADADDALPPEVTALVGMRIPPKVANVEPAEVPKFSFRDGMVLRFDKSGNGLRYRAGVISDKWPVLIFERLYKDKTTEIIDVKMLPENSVDWKYENHKFINLEGRYRFGSCRQGPMNNGNHIILGLVKPEKNKSDCAHFSKQVKMAWLIDEHSGRVTSMPTKNVQCEFITMDSCY